MTSYTKSLMLAAAACAIAAGNAAAQTYHAEIPFTFRAGTTMLPPGEYDISFKGAASNFMTLRNTETLKSIMLQTVSMTGEQKGQRAPALRFECGSRCALQSMWVGGWPGAYKLHTPRLGPNEMARVLTVELTRVKAD
jgi:hypothetical protein